MPIYEITVTHLSGARRSQVETFTKLPLRLGRADECEVRFDPDADRQVSAVHAEVALEGEQLVIRDLESKNGLLLDGRPVEGDVPLPMRATVEVGPSGPKLQIAWETATGISFSRLKKGDSGPRPQGGRPLASTDAAVPVLPEEALREPDAVKGRGALLLLLLLLVAGGAAAWFFTR